MVSWSKYSNIPSIGLTLQTWWKGVQIPHLSSEYQEWRQHFLRDRLHLAIVFAMVILAGLAVLSLTVVVPAINASSHLEHFVSPAEVWSYLSTLAAQEMGLLLCLLLLSIPVARHCPGGLFLWFSWSILWLPQLQALLWGEVELDSTGWIIVYMAQAILMPVRWRLHVISQVSVLGYVAIATALGLRDLDVPPDLTGAAYASVGFYTLFVCVIADLGVFLYEQLLQREFELRQQLRLFLHAVSHDLRNPVLGTLMVLKNFQATAGDSAQIPKAVLDRMIESGDRQLQLINLLLETHAAETAGMVLHRRSTYLSDLVASVVTDLEPFFMQSNASLHMNFPKDLPPVNVDSLQIRRVYENLIANALKHNSPGLELYLSAEVVTNLKCTSRLKSKSLNPGQKWLQCRVSNNGDSLTSDQCARLFNLYSRGPCARQTLEVGLGLYICQQIVEAHGGTIGVQSTPFCGTTFWFTLPLVHEPKQ